MNTTSHSLLLRLKKAGLSGDGNETTGTSAAWTRFVELYTPLIFYWARKTGMQPQDASDLVQEVMAVVIRKLPSFEYDRTRSFRGWLRTVTLNKYREQLRKRKLDAVPTSNSFLGQLADPKLAESTWDLQYAKELIANATVLLQGEFAPDTWNALKILLTSGRPVGEIASQTGISKWTIYPARSRLLSRLRKELDGLLD